MRKFTKKLTNSVDSANCNFIKQHIILNNTTNATISPAIFNRECVEYDNGILPAEHDLYLGERYG